MVFTSHAVTHPNILPSQRSSKLHSSPSQLHLPLGRSWECSPTTRPSPEIAFRWDCPEWDEINRLQDRHWDASTISVLCLAPIHFRRTLPRPSPEIVFLPTFSLTCLAAEIEISAMGRVQHTAKTTSGLGRRVVSYYALFKGWLLLSQPPTCLRQRTSFSLSIDFGTLICDLGCFPCVHEASPSHTHWYRYLETPLIITAWLQWIFSGCGFVKISHHSNRYAS